MSRKHTNPTAVVSTFDLAGALAKLHVRRVEDFIARFGAKHGVTSKSPKAAIEAAIKAEAL